MDKNKKDYLITTLGFQLLVCAILFGVCFGIKVTQPELLSTLKNEYFEKIDENLILEKLDDNAESTTSSNTEENVIEVIENTEINNNLTTEFASEELTAEIKAEGGADVSIHSENEIPENVSVNGYSLNQKMILPVKGETTSEFGVRTHPIDGDLRFHAGIDIAAPTGTSIYAAYDGTVIKSTYDPWNGNYLKIQHDNGIMTVYCHCETLNVKAGEVVRAGEIVATVGSTGSSTGPHLHFELRVDGVSYNPQSALDDAISAV